MTDAQRVARNTEIARLRDVERLSYEQIAARFGLTTRSTIEAYAGHLDAQQAIVDIEEAKREMHEYIRALEAMEATLAKILNAPETPVTITVEVEGQKEPSKYIVQPPSPADRVRAAKQIANLIFQAIAIKRAVGVLPVNFQELEVASKFNEALSTVLGILDEHNVSPLVFREIAAALRERQIQHGGVPKTHLADAADLA